MRVIVVFAFLGACLAWVPCARAEAEPPRLQAVRTAAVPVLDGKLDDAVWATTAADDRFTQLFPEERAPPSERTAVRVLYDDRAVYIGLRMDDSDAQRIVSQLTVRDRAVESDWVSVEIDSRRDRATALTFRVNAAGVKLDGMVYNDTELTDEWDGVWYSAVSKDVAGWTAEIEIPLSVLRFSDEEVQAWGFQVTRYISRRKETDQWVLIPSTAGGYVSRFGLLEGLGALRPRRTFELRPFASLRVQGRTEGEPSFLMVPTGEAPELHVEAGLDLKLGLTSDLTLDLALNPDFGLVEADEVVLNLSLFEVFFPEKRPFFLEGVDVFQTPLGLFYSRRIGAASRRTALGRTVVDDAGRQLRIVEAPGAARIWSAAKVVGEAYEDLTIGTMAAVTGSEEVITTAGDGMTQAFEMAPERLFFAGRGRYAIGDASYVGAMATAATRIAGEVYDAYENHDEYVQSIDGRWQSADARWRLSGQVALSERIGGTSGMQPSGGACATGAGDCIPITRQDGTRLGPGDVGYAGSMQAIYQGERWLVNGAYRSMSSKFDPNAMGFLLEFNQQELDSTVSYRQTRPIGPLQEYTVSMQNWLVRDHDGFMVRSLSALELGGQDRMFNNYLVNVAVLPPGTWDPYVTGDGARLERPFRVSGVASVETDTRKSIVASIAGDGVSDVDGPFWRATIKAGLQGRLMSTLQFEVLSDVRLHRDLMRFYGCVDEAGSGCTVDSPIRNYTFARFDSTSLSLTGRLTFAPTSRLVFQGYTQVFLAKGSYADYVETQTEGARPGIRFADFTPSAFDGDADGDGRADAAFRDVVMNMNAAVHWQLRPGTRLSLLYSREQQGRSGAVDAALLRVRGLFHGRTEDVLLMKFVYFLDSLGG